MPDVGIQQRYPAAGVRRVPQRPGPTAVAERATSTCKPGSFVDELGVVWVCVCVCGGGGG